MALNGFILREILILPVSVCVWVGGLMCDM